MLSSASIFFCVYDRVDYSTTLYQNWWEKMGGFDL